MLRFRCEPDRTGRPLRGRAYKWTAQFRTRTPEQPGASEAIRLHDSAHSARDAVAQRLPSEYPEDAFPLATTPQPHLSALLEPPPTQIFRCRNEMSEPLEIAGISGLITNRG
ncbi:hypothetical protein GCM10009854_45380 [Saccharopolyspora halophila]|uniref:Integrase n=1 Tax=Saccharopolyspora halophila TaxID=405551 RepID=A0ABN3GU33_9PSEU